MSLILIPRSVSVDADGTPRVGAEWAFYEAGTSTPIILYTTAALDVEQENPVQSLGNGYFPAVYVDSAANPTHKQVMTDADGVVIFSEDNIGSSGDEQLRADLADGETDGKGSSLVAIKLTNAEIAAGLEADDIADFSRDPGDIRRYGAIGDNSTDSASAILMAIDVAEAGGGEVYIPAGIFRFGAKLEFSAPAVSARALRLRGDSCDRSILRKAYVGTGIEVSNFARPAFENFTLDLASGVTDTGVGILATRAANQWSIRNVVVSGQGSHGVEVIEANLCTMQDVLVFDNGGDGVKLNGAATPDVNACTLINIDARENTGWGVNFNNAWSNFGFGITTQSNVAGGVRLNNARQNSLHIYSESNSGPNIQLVDTAECKGNFLTVLEGGVTYGGTTADRNTVLHTKRGPTFDSNFSKVTANKFLLPSELQDGTGVGGSLTIDHTVDATYDVTHAGFDTDCATRFVHSNASFKHRVDADALLLKKAASTCAANQVMLGSSVQATVGAAGAATALPANPTGYLIINVAGTPRVIPYYAAS